jgi:hypothetical protein
MGEIDLRVYVCGAEYSARASMIALHIKTEAREYLLE